MGRVATIAVIAGVSLGRFAAFVTIAMLAVPALATAPSDAAPAPLLQTADLSLAPEVSPRETERRERAAFPTEMPRVPVNDALRPPQLLWNPTPSSLVKVVPAKVRYRLRF